MERRHNLLGFDRYVKIFLGLILFGFISFSVNADDAIAQYDDRQNFHPDQNQNFQYTRVPIDPHYQDQGDLSDRVLDIIGGSDAPLLALIVGALGLFIWKNEQSARADRTKLSDRLFEVIKESQVGMDNVTNELTAIKITNADTNARVAGLEREMEGIKERFMVMKV